MDRLQLQLSLTIGQFGREKSKKEVRRAPLLLAPENPTPTETIFGAVALWLFSFVLGLQRRAVWEVESEREFFILVQVGSAPNLTRMWKSSLFLFLSLSIAYSYSRLKVNFNSIKNGFSVNLKKNKNVQLNGYVSPENDPEYQDSRKSTKSIISIFTNKTDTQNPTFNLSPQSRNATVSENVFLPVPKEGTMIWRSDLEDMTCDLEDSTCFRRASNLYS